MIKFHRYNVFLPDTGWSYDFVLPVDQVNALVIDCEAECIEDVLQAYMKYLDQPDAVVIFDEEFERENVKDGMAEGDIPALVICDDNDDPDFENIATFRL